MKLYVMRHGPAEDQAHTGRDGDRALTPDGRERVRDVVKALKAANEAPLSIVSSPLVRAVQTAEIVAAAAGLDGAVEIRKEMGPSENKMSLLAAMLGAGRKRLMIVGHEPDLSMLVARLVGSPPHQGMKKAMVVGLKLEQAASAGPGFQAFPRFVLDPKTLAWDRSG